MHFSSDLWRMQLRFLSGPLCHLRWTRRFGCVLLQRMYHSGEGRKWSLWSTSSYQAYLIHLWLDLFHSNDFWLFSPLSAWRMSENCQSGQLENGSLLRTKEIRVQAEVKQFTCIGYSTYQSIDIYFTYVCSHLIHNGRNWVLINARHTNKMILQQFLNFKIIHILISINQSKNTDNVKR